jgi:predicted DNA-binding transcriptional regulator YafY
MILKRSGQVIEIRSKSRQESDTRSLPTMRLLLKKAMQNPDDFVIAFEYLDNEGIRTKRVVSPIRFLAENRFLALCLCREEPRQFHLDRCFQIELVRAQDVLMPVPMG